MTGYDSASVFVPPTPILDAAWRMDGRECSIALIRSALRNPPYVLTTGSMQLPLVWTRDSATGHMWEAFSVVRRTA